MDCVYIIVSFKYTEKHTNWKMYSERKKYLFHIFTLAPRSNDSDQYGRQAFQLSYSVSRQNQTPLVLSSGLVNNNNNKSVTNSNISKSNLYSGKWVIHFSSNDLRINLSILIRPYHSISLQMLRCIRWTIYQKTRVVYITSCNLIFYCFFSSSPILRIW